MAKIQIRRGTSADWSKEGPTLSLAELGYETDTNRIKIGNLDVDGVGITWSALDYFSYKDVVIEDVRLSYELENYTITDIGRLVYDQESKEVFVYDGSAWVSVSTGQVPTPTLSQVCREGFFTSTPIAARDFLVSGGTPELRGSVETEDLRLRSINNATDKFYGVTLRAPDLMRGIISYQLTLPEESGETGELLMKGDNNNLIWASSFPYEQLKLLGRFANEYELDLALADKGVVPNTGDLYLVAKYYGYPYPNKPDFDTNVGGGALPFELDVLLLWVKGASRAGADENGSWQNLGSFNIMNVPGPDGPQGPRGLQGPYGGDWGVVEEDQPKYILGRNKYVGDVDDNFTTVNNNIDITNNSVNDNHNAIVNLQQELENALPSLNRATYDIVISQVIGSSAAGGGYTSQILVGNDGNEYIGQQLPDYENTTDVYLNSVDKFGVNQSWQTLLDDLSGADGKLERDYLLEMRNEQDDSFAVFEILDETGWSGTNSTGPGATINLKVKVIRFKGAPPRNNTPATIKIYSTQNASIADLDLRYLRKSSVSTDTSYVRTDFNKGITVNTLMNVDVDEVNARAVTKFVIDTPVITFRPPINKIKIADGRYITTRLNFAEQEGLGIVSGGFDTPLLRIFGTKDNVETLGLDIKANGNSYWLHSPQLHEGVIDPTPFQIEEITAEFDLIEPTQFVHKYYVDRSIQLYTEGKFFDLNVNSNTINGSVNFKKSLNIQTASEVEDTDSLAITVLSGTEPAGDVNTELTFTVDVAGDIVTKGSNISALAAHARFSRVSTDSVSLAKEPTNVSHAVTKRYVDSEFSRVKDNNYYVPVGSIMMWLASTPPKGWWFLSGNSFDVKLYPDLHNYLRDNVSTYKSGVMPNWDDQYFVQKGVNSGTDLGGKIGWKTAMPKGDNRIVIKEAGVPPAIYHVKSGPGAGHGSGANLLRPSQSTEPKSNTYDITARAGTEDGIHNHVFEGGDNITRPDSVVGRYIMKGDFK